MNEIVIEKDQFQTTILGYEGDFNGSKTFWNIENLDKSQKFCYLIDYNLQYSKIRSICVGVLYARPIRFENARCAQKSHNWTIFPLTWAKISFQYVFNENIDLYKCLKICSKFFNFEVDYYRKLYSKVDIRTGKIVTPELVHASRGPKNYNGESSLFYFLFDPDQMWSIFKTQLTEEEKSGRCSHLLDKDEKFHIKVSNLSCYNQGRSGWFSPLVKKKLKNVNKLLRSVVLRNPLTVHLLTVDKLKMKIMVGIEVLIIQCVKISACGKPTHLIFGTVKNIVSVFHHIKNQVRRPSFYLNII